MSTQIGFDRFEENTETTDETGSDPWDFEEYGPTMDEPIPEAERMALHESGGELVDEREIPDSGLSLSDITDWPYINEERDRPDRRAKEAETIARLESKNQDVGKESDTIAADGGVARADFENLTEIGRGSVLTLDKVDGEYLVVDRNENPIDTVQSLDVVDHDGDEYRLNVVALGGERYFDMIEGHETPFVKNTANIEDIRDFEVINHDQEWLESYFAETIPHFNAD